MNFYIFHYPIVPKRHKKHNINKLQRDNTRDNQKAASSHCPVSCGTKDNTRKALSRHCPTDCPTKDPTVNRTGTFRLSVQTQTEPQ